MDHTKGVILKYQGGKTAQLKYILPIITEGRTEEPFYDFFCGGGSVSSRIDGEVYAIDNHFYTIEALKLIRDNPEMLPKNNKEFTREHYDYFRHCFRTGDVTVHPGLFGWIGYSIPFASKFYDMWVKDINRKGSLRDRVQESYRASVRQSYNLQNVSLIHSSYEDITPKEGSYVYCDPPYKNTQPYPHIKTQFDYEKFYDWCRYVKNDLKCRVFVSEHEAPFELVWERSVSVAMSLVQGSKNRRKRRVDRLFKV